MPEFVYISPQPDREQVPIFDRSAFKIYRRWERQKRPYSSPLPYTYVYEYGKGVDAYGTGYWGKGYATGNNGFGSNPMAQAVNTALSRLRDKLGDSAQLAVAVAEYRSAFDMIADRAISLRRAYRSFRRLDFASATKHLVRNGRRPSAPGASTRARARAGDVSGAWLEYWWGWAPLVDDVSTAVRVVSGGVTPPKAVLSARASASDEILEPYQHSSVQCKVLVQAKFAIADRNRILAAQLGLTNPLSLAWELIPFSWLVDWFSSVGTYLDSFDWWNGYQVTDAFSTKSWECSDKYGGWIDPRTNQPQYLCGLKYFQIHRRLGLPEVTLKFAPPGRLSLSRAASAVSLLIQQLKS